MYYPARQCKNSPPFIVSYVMELTARKNACIIVMISCSIFRSISVGFGMLMSFKMDVACVPERLETNVKVDREHL